MSGLIGGEEGAYENFKEFIDTENIPDNTVLKIMEIDALRKALSVLSDADNEFDRMTVFWTVFCGLFKILSSVFISCLEQKSIQLQIELEFSYSIFGEVCPRYRTRCIRQRMLRVLLLCDTHCGIPVLF